MSIVGSKNVWQLYSGTAVSVRCPDLGDVRFSEVSNVLTPFRGGCPLFGGSVMRGSTVMANMCKILIMRLKQIASYSCF